MQAQAVPAPRRVLERELADARRQIAELTVGANRGGQGSNFQEFIALKREIANLRSTNAALMRQSGGCGAAPPQPLSGILGGGRGQPPRQPKPTRQRGITP